MFAMNISLFNVERFTIELNALMDVGNCEIFLLLYSVAVGVGGGGGYGSKILEFHTIFRKILLIYSVGAPA